MNEEWKISYREIIILFGFLFFSLGLLGIIQIGILENLLEIIPLSLTILLIGIVLLILTTIKKIQE